MIKRLHELFADRARTGVTSGPRLAERELQQATAALLIEAARSDFAFDQTERGRIELLLRERFSLGHGELQEMMQAAEAEVEQATSLHQFTRILDINLDPEEKRSLLQMLWEIAFIDGRIDKYEEYLIRRLADLLHLPHSDFIKAKLRASQRIQGGAK